MSTALNNINPQDTAARPASNIRLRPHVEVVQTDDSLIVVGDVTWMYESPPRCLRTALEVLAQPRGARREELSEILGSGVAAELCSLFEEMMFIQTSSAPFPVHSPGCGLSAYCATAMAREFAGWRDYSVTIVGCGAVGGEVARHLAASGVGQIVLVDYDRVAASNLNRQYLFTLQDVGRSKVATARESLERLNASVQVVAIEARIQQPRDLLKLGLPATSAVLCCADTPPGRIGRIVYDYSVRTGALFGIAGVGVFAGSWGPILTRNSKVTYSEPLQLVGGDLHQVLDPVAASFGPTNSIIAGALARDVLHALAGDPVQSLDARVELNFASLELKRRPLSSSALESEACTS